MINYFRFVARVVLIASLVLLSTPSAVSADTTLPPENDHEYVNQVDGRLKAELIKEGFEVKEGYFKLWRIEDCPDSFSVLGSCFFNNPAAPYVLPVLPYWADEFIDPATKGVTGSTRPGYSTTFRLDPNEAIILYGYLPPEAAYFGQQTYVFTRKGTFDTTSLTYNFLSQIGGAAVFFHEVPQNPERIVLFSSLSDSRNNVVIEEQSGGVWNELKYFIITPNQHMDEQVRLVLQSMSVDYEDIFTEAIPFNVNIGLEADADDFLTGLRYSMPSDGGNKGSASSNWRKNPTMRVLRVRDTSQDAPVQRYPSWEDDSPEIRTAVTEIYLRPDLINLVYTISQQWEQPCADITCATRAVSFIDTQSKPFNLVGPKCDNIGMDCLGDTQDASYQFRSGFSFDNNEVYAVVGTLGTITGNATYVSLGVNNFRLRLGAKNIDGNRLLGSTMPEFYPGVNNLDKFYVFYFTRDCSGLEELTHGFCESIGDSPLLIPVGDRASIVERDYLKEGSRRGPDSSLTLPSMVLRLQKPTN